jgi:ankyrin repeat protein
MRGSLECAAILLDSGADPSFVPPGTHFSPLFLAAQSGSTDLVNMLFDKSAIFDVKLQGKESPLNEAIRLKHTECFQILLDRGFRPTTPADQRDASPLILALRGQLFDAIPFLLEKGSNVNVVSSTGLNPLFLACRYRRFDLVEQICKESDSRLDIDGPGDSKAIHWAAMSCVPEIVRYIISLGADVKAKNGAGETAIAEALRFRIADESEPGTREKDVSDQIATIKILVEAGLSINDRRNRGSDTSFFIVNYLTRENQVDVRVIEYLFSVGIQFETVASESMGKTLGDLMWAMTRDPEIRDLVRSKLIAAGYKPPSA